MAKNNARKSKRRLNSKKKRTSRKKSIITGLSGLALGAGLYSMYKKAILPKQGFVFTPAFEEKGMNCLLIIDPQKDFMDSGSLPVTGASDDMDRLGDFIENNTGKIQSICVTLDTHSLFHIGNKFAYTTTDNKEVDTDKYPISYDPINYIPKQGGHVPGLKKHIDSYARKLGEKGGMHMLWPLHCQLGTSGHTIFEPLQTRLEKWSTKSSTEVRYIIKGCDTKYENFSVFRSAGVDKHNYSNPNKEAYKFNLDLAKHLYQFPNLYIAGEARTHCVFDSTSDYVGWVNSKGNPKKQQIYILWDCMSDVNVPGQKDTFKLKREAFEQLIKSNSFMHKIDDAKEANLS